MRRVDAVTGALSWAALLAFLWCVMCAIVAAVAASLICEALGLGMGDDR